MRLDFADLTQIPEFKALLATIEEQGRELKHLRARHTLQWVNDAQAQEITGLSRRTLLRERRRPDTVIVYKEDHGVRYNYDSLLAHNDRHALGRARLPQLATAAGTCSN